MSFLYWLNLFGSVSLLVLAGLFIKSSRAELAWPSTCEKLDRDPLKSPHPFLCGQRIPVRDAKVAELIVVDGISFNDARSIRAYFASHPESGLTNLEDIPGIGPKTLEQLRAYFF